MSAQIVPFNPTPRAPMSAELAAAFARLALPKYDQAERLIARLRSLDAEQLQIVELVIIAIKRGGVP